jgi:hypothetical protein
MNQLSAFATRLTDHYAAAELEVPLRWEALHGALQTVLTRLAQRDDLPVSIVHGDAWAGNTIQMRMALAS